MKELVSLQAEGGAVKGSPARSGSNEEEKDSPKAKSIHVDRQISFTGLKDCKVTTQLNDIHCLQCMMMMTMMMKKEKMKKEKMKKVQMWMFDMLQIHSHHQGM
jgi:hypothetical protein